jgi:hypothetical protein
MKDKECYEIIFGDIISVSAIEKALEQHYSQSVKKIKSCNIIFDLTHIKWIGFFPACLLFSWISLLDSQKKTTRVEIKLSNQIDKLPQAKKILINYGIIARLKELNVTTQYHFSEYPTDGIPLTIIYNQADLWELLQKKSSSLINKLKLNKQEQEIVKTAFDIILYELLENTFNHAEGKLPHFGMSCATSSGAKSNFPGFFAVFDRNTPYVEISLGDHGPGIHKNLEALMPSNYEPPFGESHRFLKYEKIISYAFEFSSTSEPGRRKKRIEQLIGETSIDPFSIATGLFCVLEVARMYQGQLIVRTPMAILGIDYYKHVTMPRVTGKNNLGIKRLAGLKGTHYLLRIPLKASAVKRPSYHPLPLDYNINVETIQPFANAKQNENDAEMIQDALTKIENHLFIHRKFRGLTIILPPPYPLISRAILLFIAALHAMQHGKQLLIWCNPRAYTVLDKGNHLISKDDKASLRSSPILVGDLMRNRFVLVGNYKLLERTYEKKFFTTGRDFFLDKDLLGLITRKYISTLSIKLQEVLQHKNVRHLSGQFLIEKKYYTTKFYEIPKAFKSKSHTRRFAEWCSYYVDDFTDVIISTSETIRDIADDISLLKSKDGHRLDVLVLESPLSPASTFLKVFPYKGKNAVILTDVICRGENLNQLLSFIHPLGLCKIITLVDARHKQAIGKPVQYNNSEQKSSLIDVVALLKDEITPYKDPPGITQVKQDEIYEAIHVIDRSTRAPTLYVRPESPKKKLKDILHATLESSSLYPGHYEFDKKHYSFFLNLPKLFEFLRIEIQDWIKEQVDFFKKASPEKKIKWKAYVYNPEGNLTWSELVIDFLPTSWSINVVTRKDLLAPSPPASEEENTKILIFLPAMASGESARLCIEYSSRENPEAILVLCFMARMDPHHRTFFAGIKKYRNALLHSSFFLDFPICAHESKETCPMCQYVNILENIIINVERQSKPFKFITELLKRKVSISRCIKLEYSGKKTLVEKEVTNQDVAKAYLRSLYEAADYNLSARHKLNNLLIEEKDYVDRFLELISKEYCSIFFSPNELDRRLYKSLPIIKNRLHQILAEANPPFPVGKFIGAFLHFIPQEFLSNAVELLHRFLVSVQDVEEIVTGLLVYRVYPVFTKDILSICREKGLKKQEQLLIELIHYLRLIKEQNNEDCDASILTFSKLWSRLSRSSDFADSLDALYLMNESSNVDITEFKKHSDKLIIGWKSEVSILISTMSQSLIGQNLSESYPKLWSNLGLLGRNMARFELLYRLIEASESDPIKISKDMNIVLTQMKSIKKTSADILYKFFINPVKCKASSLPSKITTTDGSILHFTKDIDQYIPNVFFNLGDLDFMCEQLISNWQKHKTKTKEGKHVWFKIFEKDNVVWLEFRDDIEGDFDLSSEGGLRIVQKYCRLYGAEWKTKKTDSPSKEKAFSILLRPVS